MYKAEWLPHTLYVNFYHFPLLIVNHSIESTDEQYIALALPEWLSLLLWVCPCSLVLGLPFVYILYKYIIYCLVIHIGGSFPVAQWWRIRWQCRSHRRLRFNPWFRKIPWRSTWQATPVFTPGESQDRGPWWATVRRQMKQLSTHTGHIGGN